MRALFEAIMTGDGRLVSPHRAFTYDGEPWERLVCFEVEVGPGEDEDDDEREAA